MSEESEDKNWENIKILLPGTEIKGITTMTYSGNKESLYDTKVHKTKREDGATVIILEKRLPMGHYENRKMMTDPIVLPVIPENELQEVISNIVKEFENSIDIQLKSPK